MVSISFVCDNSLFEHEFISVLFELRANVPSYSQWLESQDLFELGSMLLVCKQTSCMCVCVCVCVCVLLDTPETKCRVGPLSGKRRQEES